MAHAIEMLNIRLRRTATYEQRAAWHEIADYEGECAAITTHLMHEFHGCRCAVVIVVVFVFVGMAEQFEQTETNGWIRC